MVGSSISSRNTLVKRSASSSSLSAPPQTYSVAGAAARISSSRRAGFHAQLCWESQAKSGSSGSSTTLPAASADRASNGSSSASMTARPRRASTAARLVFPAPEQPVIWTALIGVYRRPAPMAGANEFVIPRGRTGASNRRERAAGVTRRKQPRVNRGLAVAGGPLRSRPSDVGPTDAGGGPRTSSHIRVTGRVGCVLAQARILAFSRSNSSAVMTPRSRRSASLASWSAELGEPAVSWT